MTHRRKALADPRNLRPRSVRRGERGSAFIVALLVLVVLTIVGLALTLMTQTEVRIGANEREANRTFYAADSGIHHTTTRHLWIGPAQAPLTFSSNTTAQDISGATGPTTFSDQIVVTPLYGIHQQPCNLCAVNENPVGGDRKGNMTYVVNSSSARVGVNGQTTQAMAQKLIGTMIGLQPWHWNSGMNYNSAVNVKF